MIVEDIAGDAEEELLKTVEEIVGDAVGAKVVDTEVVEQEMLRELEF